MLICGTCGSFDPNGHVCREVEEMVDAHRNAIEYLVAEVMVSRQETIAATNAIKIIRGELEGNRDAAIKMIDVGFNKLPERQHSLTRCRSDNTA